MRLINLTVIQGIGEIEYSAAIHPCIHMLIRTAVDRHGCNVSR